VNEKQSAGTYSIAWDGRDDAGNRVSSGIYFYKLTSGSFSQMRKMMLLK
jgi:flagellar hook assembly protein FlgD